MTQTEPQLRTVLFTDIVGSTERAAELGDRGWREVLLEHHNTVRRELRRFGGREANTAGDGFLATFDRPARAIRCAWSIREAVRELGLEVRSGIHAGEVEGKGAAIGGMTVHIGARVAAQAHPGEVLVSQAVRELVTGAAFRFEDRGVHTLKGVPGEWRLHALKGLPPGPSGVRTTRWVPELTVRQLVVAIVVLGLLAGLPLLYRTFRDAGHLATGEAMAGVAPGIAVLPFQVTGPGLEVWREGMVDLLSTNLDGTAGLRTIDSRTVLARWREAVPGTEPADLNTALEVGRRAGARYVLAGSAVAIGGDVRLTAVVYDATTGANLGQGQVEGAPDSVFALVDRLSIEVLRAILRREAGELPSVDLARVTTTSLPALKAYLEGEIHYRRSDFDAAIPAYERAVESDSTFALANARLTEAYGWAEAIQSDLGEEAIERAARFADRLPERDAILVRASWALTHGSLDGVESLREAVRRYPDDPEAWYLLGDTYFHLGKAALVDWRQSDEAFAHAIELDPRYAPAYIHRIDWALRQADSARAAELLAAYGRIAGGSRYHARYRLAFDLAFGEPGARARALAALETLDPATANLNNISNVSLTHPRFLDVQADVLEVSRRVSNPFAAETAHLWLFFNGLQRGNLREALEMLESPGYPADLRGMGLYLARVRGFPIPVERLEEELAAHAADTLPAPVFYAGAHAAETGRWAAHAAAVERLRDQARKREQAGDSIGSRFVAATAQALEGLEAWKRGRRLEALEVLQRAQREATGVNRPQEIINGTIRWWIGELLIEMGRPRDAVRYFTLAPLDSLLAYRRAQIYEQLGEHAKAREEYQTFLLGWRDPDPELQPLAEQARQAVIRLRGLRRG
jgi:class 3 adenylate cyclase/tetratricopeptide (TPR) repeat protein